jgi:hypothetical protein
MKTNVVIWGSILLLSFLLGGCEAPPARLSWDDQLPVTGPVSEGPYGSLVVYTPQGAGTGDDVEKCHTFYLYGADGKLLERFPNESALPVRVRPGKYIVVGTGLPGLRRVQVEIKEDMTTVVRLADLERAPRAE